MPNPTISVILPVYNGEKYLGRAIESVLAQSFGDFEIICINDVSPDNSQKVIDQYCKKDKRVKSIIHKENKGHGPARNTGIKAAEGDYIFHIDPDDTIPENAFEILYTTAQEYDSDIVKGGYLHEFSNGRKRHIASVPKGEMVVNCNIHESSILQKIPSGHWAALYNSRIFKNVFYPEDVNFAYDMVYLCDGYIAADKVTLINDCVYNYRFNGESVMNVSVNLKKAAGELIWRRKVYNKMCAAGLEEAAKTRYKASKEYTYSSFWKPMPSNLSRDEIIVVFDLIREHTDELGLYPWGDDTPLHIVTFLTTVLANEDDKAIALLIDDNKVPGGSQSFMQERESESLEIYSNKLNKLYSSKIWRLIKRLGLAPI